MTRLLALLSVSLMMSTASAADINIGFLSLDNDPRYAEEFVYARIELRPTGDALKGAELGIIDSEMIAQATGNRFVLKPDRAGDVGGLKTKAEEMVAAGAQYVVLDLPGDAVDQLVAAAKDLPVTFVNATAPDDVLRQRCYTNLLHTAASDRMTSDAMVQFLRTNNWTKVLLLVGQEARDTQIAQSFRKSAERYRLDIVDERPFTLSSNPENRELNNSMLLTGGLDYDVIYLADSRGEFGRFLPYATQLPRPIVGSTGLVATEWHWSLERYGAPQVNSRFEALADGRRMAAQDWSTWMAVKAITSAYARSRVTEPAEIDQYLRGPRLRIDGSKGVIMNFRPWDGQMRMPVMLVTHNAVISIPPLDGFLHQFNTLDTLGTDEPEHQCL
jgi:ABC transporter substrate binding protein (PQQ-dependent alcohol dehydrogenase system)